MTATPAIPTAIRAADIVARRPRTRSVRRWAALSTVLTGAVLVSATVIGVDLGATGATATPVPQAIVAPPAATAPGAGGGPGGVDQQARTGGRGDGGRHR